MPPTYITANQRLASYIRDQYDQTQQAKGEVVWETLDCLSLKQWVLRTYRALPQSMSLVLSDQQAQVLWANVIAHVMDEQPDAAFLSIPHLAKTAQAAWRLLKEAQIDLPVLAGFESQEVSAFYQWACAFEQLCVEKNYVDFNACMQQVILALSANQLTLPTHIILVGFEEIPLQTKKLFSLLSAQCELSDHPSNKIENPCVERAKLDNEIQELEAMVRWAYHLHIQNPYAFIGCVVPDLNSMRHTIIRLFNQWFSPSTFNVSGGFPLAHFPLIQSALDILKLSVSTSEIALLSRLLLSPFIGGAEQEYIARAELDIQLRQTQEPAMEWQQLLYWARKIECPLWLAHCEQYAAHYVEHTYRQSAYAWSGYFTAQLQRMGWPGERKLNSAEYQQVQRWHVLLEEFSSLDVVLKQPISMTEARHHLMQLAKTTLFQPQTEKAPVQILGLLEAVGLSFDGLWISGMTQTHWPRKAAPNPFIPLSLQRVHHMPHSSAEREWAYSRQLTQHFCRSAKTVLFSHASQKEDQLQLPSALLMDIPEISVVHAPWFAEQRPFVTNSSTLEYLLDEQAPRLQSKEIRQGGASIFKYQAACPFQAFARLRLGATSMPLPAFHMTPKERGECLHAVLEQVWRKLVDHQTLCQHDEVALMALLKPIAQKVLTRIARRRPLTLTSHFMQLEEQRVISQVVQWLTLEKQRPAFRVMKWEAEQQVYFAGLMLALRLDREDQLADGSRMIVDYKTGTCSTADWFGDRPDDPQLPLYGVTCEHSIEGLAFAQITADKQQFSGISQKACDIPGIQAITQYRLAPSLYTWDAFFADIQTTLTRLAQDFQKGYAKVDPKQPEKTCRYCDLQSLCRIREH